MKIASKPSLVLVLILASCSPDAKDKQREALSLAPDSTIAVKIEEPKPKIILPGDIQIRKDFLFDKHTLEDTYPYKDTTRMYQWDKIREGLARLENYQRKPMPWAVLQNNKNKSGEAALVKKYTRNAYKNVQDTLGVERYQSVPLYLLADTVVPERYGRDGELVELVEDGETFVRLKTVYTDGEWFVPKRYVHFTDTLAFTKVIFVDRTNQNVATLEKVGDEWLVRSMNPVTTGAHNPPYQHETPLGIFVIQEKKTKMFYYVDGTTRIAGYAPYASRFSNGGYLHGIPINKPRESLIEYSQTLGTIPRSHMCVRNATSHAKFVFDWAPVDNALVFVIE